jgi:hypothetical protein
MPTLEDFLNDDLGVSQSKQVEKTASAESDEIEKLAMEIGLVDAKTEPTSKPSVQTKEAQMSMTSIYDDLFPEDVALNKVASQEDAGEFEKLAAVEEALGAKTYDFFQERFDARITKLAEESIAQGSEPPQQLPNNKKGGNSMIHTDPQIDNELPPEAGQAVVGKEESRQMQVKAAAVRKHMLLAQLEE